MSSGGGLRGGTRKNYRNISVGSFKRKKKTRDPILKENVERGGTPKKKTARIPFLQEKKRSRLSLKQQFKSTSKSLQPVRTSSRGEGVPGAKKTVDRRSVGDSGHSPLTGPPGIVWTAQSVPGRLKARWFDQKKESDKRSPEKKRLEPTSEDDMKRGGFLNER